MGARMKGGRVTHLVGSTHNSQALSGTLRLCAHFSQAWAALWRGHSPRAEPSSSSPPGGQVIANGPEGPAASRTTGGPVPFPQLMLCFAVLHSLPDRPRPEPRTRPLFDCVRSLRDRRTISDRAFQQWEKEMQR